MFLLQTSDLGVRIVAGELLALMYEVGRNVQQDFGYRDRNGVCDSIRELATEGTKHVAKKDLRQQRSSFRDILKTIEVNCFPLVSGKNNGMRNPRVLGIHARSRQLDHSIE